MYLVSPRKFYVQPNRWTSIYSATRDSRPFYCSTALSVRSSPLRSKFISCDTKHVTCSAIPTRNPSTKHHNTVSATLHWLCQSSLLLPFPLFFFPSSSSYHSVSSCSSFRKFSTFLCVYESPRPGAAWPQADGTASRLLTQYCGMRSPIGFLVSSRSRAGGEVRLLQTYRLLRETVSARSWESASFSLADVTLFERRCGLHSVKWLDDQCTGQDVTTNVCVLVLGVTKDENCEVPTAV